MARAEPALLSPERTRAAGPAQLLPVAQLNREQGLQWPSVPRSVAAAATRRELMRAVLGKLPVWQQSVGGRFLLPSYPARNAGTIAAPSQRRRADAD